MPETHNNCKKPAGALRLVAKGSGFLPGPGLRTRNTIEKHASFLVEVDTANSNSGVDSFKRWFFCGYLSNNP
jgi:hypothetical protein